MSITVNYHLTKDTITLTYDGKIRTVNRNTDVGDQVFNLIKSGKIKDIPNLIDIGIQISKSSTNKNFEVIDGEVYCFGVPLPEVLSKKILAFIEEQLPIDIFLKFWGNLNLNPSEQSKQQLFAFLECNHFPLTPDGCFIAYKKVRSDFKDIHSGKFDNSPGTAVNMKRGDVCADKHKTCAEGLHVASYEYAKYNYGGNGSSVVLLEVKVNPADVVSVPIDYKHAKCRVCSYKVIGPIYSEHKVTVVPKSPPVTAKAKTEAKEKANTPEVKTTHLDRLQIGNYGYKVNSMSITDYEKCKSTYDRVKPSDWAKVFKQIDAVEVYRKCVAQNTYKFMMGIKDNKNYIKYYDLKRLPKTK